MLLMLQDGQTSVESGKHFVCKPSFLQTMLKDIFLAGKSMELLSSLGHRVDVLRGTSCLVALCWAWERLSITLFQFLQSKTCNGASAKHF